MIHALLNISFLFIISLKKNYDENRYKRKSVQNDKTCNKNEGRLMN